MLDIDNLLNLEEPDFVFGEDGDIIEFNPGQRAPETPAAAGGVPLHNDAGASARVRQEDGEGQQGGVQVSPAMISYLVHTTSLPARPTLVLPTLYPATHHDCT